jgi:hypothetical protein
MSGNKAIAISSCNSKFHFILILLFLLAVCLHSLFLLITSLFHFSWNCHWREKLATPFPSHSPQYFKWDTHPSTKNAVPCIFIIFG